MPFSLRRTAQLAIISGFLVQNHPPSPNSNHCIILFCTANRIFSRFYASNSHGTATERKQRTKQKNRQLFIIHCCSTVQPSSVFRLPLCPSSGLGVWLITYYGQRNRVFAICFALRLNYLPRHPSRQTHGLTPLYSHDGCTACNTKELQSRIWHISNARAGWEGDHCSKKKSGWLVGEELITF